MTDTRPAGGGPRYGLAGATILLCGTGRYQHRSPLANIPAVRATLTGLADVLVERCGAPEPTVKADPGTLAQLGTAIRKATESADRVLLIYYVGHGLVDPKGNLYLSAAKTRPDELEYTALSYEAVRTRVLNSPATLKIVILDCCFSGIAVGTLGTEELSQRTDIEGAYILTSAAADEMSLAPPGAQYTAFSGEVIRLLRDGVPADDPVITLDLLYQHLRAELEKRGYPRPRRRLIGSANDFVLTGNPARTGAPGLPPLPPLPPLRPRVRRSGMLVTALAGIASVPVLVSLRYGGTWRPPPVGVRGEVLAAWWGWLLLAAIGTAVTATAAGPAVRWIARLGAGRGRRPWRRLRVPLLALLAYVVTVLLGVTALTGGASAKAALAGCSPTTVVAVLAPAGGEEPVRQLARGFERYTAAENFGCPEAGLLVYSATTKQITAALAHGWGDEDHVAIGPVPDVWLPEWSGEVLAATSAATTAGRTLPYGTIRTIASTPMVLAVAAGSTGPGDAGLTDGTVWPSLLDTLRARRWDAVAPDPGTSVGALARIPLYHPAGRRGEPAKAVERYFDLSLDRGRFALGSDTAGLLCAPGGLRERTGYLVTEQDVARFNHGDPLGSSCPQQPSGRLRAVYAADTAILDRQAVPFNWPQTGAARSRAAGRFVAWLTGAAGRDALAAAGLRPPRAVTRDPLSTDWGVQPDLRPRPAVTAPDLVTDVRDRYLQAHRYARVLIAVDASGSMGVAAPGGSLWTVAARGATQVSGLLGSRDELGVWAFQGTGLRKLVAPGRARPAALAAALATITPRGPAPLFSAIAGAVATAGPSTVDRVTAVILLTDGENDNASALNARQFRAAVENRGVRVFAVAMGATGCAAPVLTTITTATAGRCLEAEPGTIAGPLETIVEAIL